MYGRCSHESYSHATMRVTVRLTRTEASPYIYIYIYMYRRCSYESISHLTMRDKDGSPHI